MTTIHQTLIYRGYKLDSVFESKEGDPGLEPGHYLEYSKAIPEMEGDYWCFIVPIDQSEAAFVGGAQSFMDPVPLDAFLMGLEAAAEKIEAAIELGKAMAAHERSRGDAKTEE